MLNTSGAETATLQPAPSDRKPLLTIKPRESLDEYFDRHLKICAEVIHGKYPLIDQETTTVVFILRGLEIRPAYQMYITNLLIWQPTTVWAARAFVQILATAVQSHITSAIKFQQSTPQQTKTRSVWCDYHRTFGTHNTLKCRDRKRYMANQQYMPRLQMSYEHQGGDMMPSNTPSFRYGSRQQPWQNNRRGARGREQAREFMYRRGTPYGWTPSI